MLLTLIKNSLKQLPLEQFKQFYVQSVGPLRNHLRRLSGMNGEDLEDILQETFLQAARSWHGLQDHQAALAWLMTIGRRQLFRFFDQKTKTRIFQGDLDTTDDRGMGKMDHLGTTPETIVSGQSTTRIIHDLIAGIADETKQLAIRRYYLEEWSLPEIAAAQNINASTLTTWFSRFRETARQSLEPNKDEATSRPSLVSKPKNPKRALI